MNYRQSQAILELCTEKLTKPDFLKTYGIEDAKVPEEVSSLLRQAAANHNGDFVEFALLLGFSISMPADILELIHELILEDWHMQHEDMISIMQKKASPTSITFLQHAIRMKPKLNYLDYDDYGAYFKKCLWALRAIGTPQAIFAIEECAASQDIVLKEQAEHQLAEIRHKSSEKKS